MRAADLGLTLEGFHYAPAGVDRAVLRLLAVLADETAIPRGARLAVDGTGDAEHLYPVRSSMLERRLVSERRRAADTLLWRASFELPLDLVQSPAALFALIAADGLELDLPAPGLRPITRHALALSGYDPQQGPSRLAFGSARQLAALATAVAVTATSSPAAALADAGTASTSTPTAAPTTTTSAPATTDSTPASGTTPGTDTTPAMPPAPATTTDATTTTAATTPSTTTTPAPPAPAALPAPATNAAISANRLVDTTPTTAAVTPTVAKQLPGRATRLFTAPSHHTHVAPAVSTHRAGGCSTRPHSVAIAYA
ncbi:MAG: hypothetical protein WBQ18_19130, partial [Solirubrobacteraceae bacterium]